ncbi:putative DNA polymerase III epsilon subunit [Actinacidiphila reveromycinica]|uniref:Putative DNA polymerase III epsilon subunit n=1 Tax=Actinacidiphila reveromycinica TaxID=659352 RepID=A0A7U3UXX6_9ACTN|nr:exonuclease domain-containing protein [Streptomyces sp. SN-593]BBB00827.1 putative DNA polymerase III epsilon subunit [Streptomyces sp. SN-593]
MAWHEDLLVGFDLETTGTDPRQARIVTAAVTEVKAGEPVRHRGWLADPGVPIPAETTAIHGVSTARATAEGRPAAEVVAEVADALRGYWAARVPVVVYNAPFDLTLLDEELARYALPRLTAGDGTAGPVIDPLVIDRALDRYRRGKRTLEAACGVYGVVLDGAHEAGADALAAVRVARALALRFAEAGEADLWELQERQREWYAAWAEDFQGWLRRKDATAVVDPHWPLRG